jgi:hypothetical protein
LADAYEVREFLIGQFADFVIVRKVPSFSITHQNLASLSRWITAASQHKAIGIAARAR